MKKVILTSIVAVVAIASTVAITSANNSNTQSQNQKVEQVSDWHCDFGAYGQITACYFNGKQLTEQEQHQKQVAVAQVGQPVQRIHIPADTALDSSATLAIMLLGLVGLTASIALQTVRN